MYSWHPFPPPNELFHFGIKGMKWGVRRYQNKNGTLTIEGRKRLLDKASTYKTDYANDISFKRGSKFDRIGITSEKDTGSTFVSYTKKDRVTYRANYDVLDVGSGEVAKLELKALKDIKVAGKNSQIQALIEYMGDKSLSESLASEYISNARLHNRKVKEYRKKLSDVLRGKSDADEILNEAMSKYIVRNSDVSIGVTKRLQEKGYDAVIDLWDAGFAECPIYVFDRKSTLKTTRRSELTLKEIDEAQEEFYRRYSKR